jgi:hypothetical protein
LCNLGVAVKNLLLSNKVQTVKYNKLVWKQVCCGLCHSVHL